MRLICLSILVLILPFDAQATQGAANKGCEKKADQQKEKFETLYRADEFQKAFDFLQDYRDNCEWLSVEGFLSIIHDQARAAVKLKNFQLCSEVLSKAEELRCPRGRYTDPKVAAEHRGSEKVWHELDSDRAACSKFSPSG